MTANIINYLSERETERSNVARETENYRHNRAVEIETAQHNRAMERLQEKQIAAQKSAQQYSADKASQASQQAAKLSFAGTSLSVGAAKQKAFYDYLVGSANVAATRERNSIQQRYNEGQLAIASSARQEEKRHNQATENISYLKESNTMERFSKQLALDTAEFEHKTWHDWQTVNIAQYEANTKRADMIWRNANQTGRLANDVLKSRGAGSAKSSTLDQFFQGLRD